MAIGLPKDAEGREIPLETTAVYGADGKVVTISRWVYCNAIGFLKDASRGWYAMDSGDRLVSAASLHLNPPDSWEKLEEDLGRASERDAVVSCCRYFTADKCADCPICGNTSCYLHREELAFGDILNRIRKLRGED